MIGEIEHGQKASALAVRQRLMQAKAPTFRDRIVAINRRIQDVAKREPEEHRKLVLLPCREDSIYIEATNAAKQTSNEAVSAALYAVQAAKLQLKAAEKLATLTVASNTQSLTPIRWRQIIAEVAEKHRISVRELTSHQRTTPMVHARQEMWYRLKTETRISIAEIGRRIGFDHSSGVHAIRRHKERMGL